MYFRGPLCKHTPGCTGGTCGITGTWAPLGCSGLLCATSGKAVVQTHTWMYWGHMWHPWHLWHPWGPQGMQMYTYTCGWAHELQEKAHDMNVRRFSGRSRAPCIASREPHRTASQPAIQPASHPASQANTFEGVPSSQPASQPGSQAASQPSCPGIAVACVVNNTSLYKTYTKQLVWAADVVHPTMSPKVGHGRF